jgi:hypothetical protein
MKHRKEDLVVLRFASNECYTNIVDLAKTDPKEVSVDEKKGTWKYEEQIREIGQSRYIDPHCKYGVIGVYDRSLTEQLNSMVSASQNATEDHSGAD